MLSKLVMLFYGFRNFPHAGQPLGELYVVTRSEGYAAAVVCDRDFAFGYPADFFAVIIPVEFGNAAAPCGIVL